jgi:integrase
MSATQPLSKLDGSKLLSVEDKRDRLFLGIGLYTGRRVQEITNMTWRFLLDHSINTIYVPKQKGYHFFPRSSRLIDLIDECYEGQPVDNYFMTGRRGTDGIKPMSTTGVNKMLKKYFPLMGIETIKEASHCLRKTFAVNFLEANRDKEKEIYLLGFLQDYFGHKNMKTTLRYIGLEDKNLGALCENINYEI